MTGVPHAPAASPLAMIVPGALDQLTGGYLFDRRVVEGLREAGRSVRVVELDGDYPDADVTTRKAACAAMQALPDGSVAVIDGLALPGFADCLEVEAQRLRLLGFIHHPLSLETGIPASVTGRMAAIERRLWPMLRGLLCPSAHTAGCLASEGVPVERIAIVPPGTAHPLAHAGDRPGRPRATAMLRLLCVGTIVPRKGHLALVEALAGLQDLPWTLTCIGSLERDLLAAAALRAAIDRLGLSERIMLTGEQPAATLAAAWRDADAFVLPSSHEGYGMAYGEAMANGLPVIATTAGAIPEVVPSTAGLLVEPGDVDSLRSALRSLMVDASLRQQLARGALAAAAVLPDWPTAVRRWAEAVDRFAA